MKFKLQVLTAVLLIAATTLFAEEGSRPPGPPGGKDQRGTEQQRTCLAEKRNRIYGDASGLIRAADVGTAELHIDGRRPAALEQRSAGRNIEFPGRRQAARLLEPAHRGLE